MLTSWFVVVQTKQIKIKRFNSMTLNSMIIGLISFAGLVCIFRLSFVLSADSLPSPALVVHNDRWHEHLPVIFDDGSVKTIRVNLFIREIKWRHVKSNNRIFALVLLAYRLCVAHECIKYNGVIYIKLSLKKIERTKVNLVNLVQPKFESYGA